MAGFDVPWTEILVFLTSHAQFSFIFGQCVDHCKYDLFLERKVGVTECPRSLNLREVVTMAFFPILGYFISYHARSMHDVAW